MYSWIHTSWTSCVHALMWARARVNICPCVRVPMRLRTNASMCPWLKYMCLCVHIFLCQSAHIGFWRNFVSRKFRENGYQTIFVFRENWGTSFASFAVSRNWWDYERNEFRKTWKSWKQRKLEVKIQNLTIFLLILVKMTTNVFFGIAGHH